MLSIPLNRAMFIADVEFAPGELDRYADEGVRAFLAAYGPAPRDAARSVGATRDP